MKITGLQWDDENVEHLAKHFVSPQEIGDVCFGQHLAYRGRYGRYILYGQTSAGRYIRVIVKLLHRGMYRPITAFTMRSKEKRQYRKAFGLRS